MNQPDNLPSFSVSRLQDMAALPGQFRIILKTWFSPAVLDAAHALIRRRQVNSFLFFRNSAGLITSDDITATINCMPGTTRRHPFVFRDGWCSSCVAARHGHRCKHVAALALLCLRETDKKISPLPLLFADSPWQKIGAYLCGQTDNGRPEISWRPDDETTLLQMTKSDGLELQVRLSGPATVLMQALGIDHPSAAAAGAGYTLLQSRLVETAATETEQHLLARGSTGKKLHQDTSGLMWLARLLFLHCEPKFTLTVDKQGLYRLQTGEGEPDNGEKPLFRLTLPRHHTWELLKALGPEQFGIRTVDQARPFSRLFIGRQDDTLCVEHWCRLHDGRELSLADLEKYRYGNRYLVDATSFSLAPLPAAHRLTKKKEKKPLSLFSFAAAATKEKENSFTVERDEIPGFLETNRDALRADIHEVAPEIRQLVIVSEPDLLELTDYSEDRDWCYLAGYYLIENQQISLYELLAAAADKKQYIPGRKWLNLQEKSLSWFHCLGRERLLRDGRIKLTREELLLLGCRLRTRAEKSVKVEPDSALTFLLANNDNALPSLPRTVNNHLRRYQADGVNWLHGLYHYGLGGILADDMGLGKTHQAFGLIEQVTDAADKILIVCPAAVLYHWPEKQQKFFPELSLAVHYGQKRSFSDSLQKNIIVTTYGVLLRDIEQFATHRFKIIFFDEMHYLKNRKTGVHNAARQLQAESIFGLSGTPIENSIEEVQTLLTICLPALFSSAPARTIFKRHKTKQQRLRIKKIINPFILRRTREQVLAELPDRSEDIRFCTLHPDQVAPYRQVGQLAQGILQEAAADPSVNNFTHILTAITRLKQICDHVCLLEDCRDWERYGSGKWTEFTSLLDQCMESKLKVVVFSQFTTMLDIIEHWLASRSIDHVSIRGKVAAGERAARIKRFNTETGCRVCSASLLAGGTGIDLTGAQVVIHYDRWWNPAKEEQATARVHRMGQRHPVQVYKLVTVGTLEEKIHHLIEKKKNLAREMIAEDEGSLLKNISREELAGLFQFSG